MKASIRFVGLLVIAPVLAEAQQVPNQRAPRIAAYDLDTSVVELMPYIPAVRTRNGIAFATLEQVVVEIDSGGRAIRQLGRKGKGPREFERIASLAVAGDTLLVLDVATRRLVRVNPGGEHSAATFTTPASLASAEPFAIRNGEVLFSTVARPDPRDSEVVVVSIVQPSAAGGAYSAVGQIDLSGSVTRVEGPNGARLMLSQPFVQRDHVVVSGSTGAILIVRSPGTRLNIEPQRVRVEVIEARASQVWSVSVRPVALTGAAVEAWLDERVQSLARHFGGESVTRSTLLANVKRPPHFPTVARTALGDDGTVWIKYGSAHTSTERWTVYTEAGRSLCTVDLPGGSRPLVVSSKDAWVLEENSDGTQAVSRYRACT